jgi:hypothetical protein
MNNTTRILNQTNTSTTARTTTTELPILRDLNIIMNIYSIPIVSLIGFFLNIVCLIVLLSPKLKGDTYKYLIFKTISHLIFQFATALTPMYRCTQCAVVSSLIVNIFRFGLNFCVINVVSTYANLSEIALTYDRLYLLKQQHSKFLIKLPAFYTLIAFILIGIIANIPTFFAFGVGFNPNNNAYSFARTVFGLTSEFITYLFVFNLVQSLVVFIVLIFVNLLVTYEFKKYINRKKNLTNVNAQTIKLTNKKSETKRSTIAEANTSFSLNLAKDRNSTKHECNLNAKMSTVKINQNQNESAELKFTLMIIISCALYSVTRLFQYLNTSSTPLGIPFPIGTYLNYLSFFSTTLYYTINIFIYLIFNKNFRARFREIFHI